MCFLFCCVLFWFVNVSCEGWFIFGYVVLCGLLIGFLKCWLSCLFSRVFYFVNVLCPVLLCCPQATIVSKENTISEHFSDTTCPMHSLKPFSMSTKIKIQVSFSFSLKTYLLYINILTCLNCTILLQCCFHYCSTWKIIFCCPRYHSLILYCECTLSFEHLFIFLSIK